MMVDKEGLNIRSLSVSMKAEGAENDFKHSIIVTEKSFEAYASRRASRRGGPKPLLRLKPHIPGRGLSLNS